MVMLSMNCLLTIKTGWLRLRMDGDGEDICLPLAVDSGESDVLQGVLALTSVQTDSVASANKVDLI